MSFANQSVDIFKEQTKKIQSEYSEFHVTNLRLSKLHNKMLLKQLIVTVSLMRFFVLKSFESL